jgi:plasmid maintenance system antidote protein VapI
MAKERIKRSHEAELAYYLGLALDKYVQACGGNPKKKTPWTRHCLWQVYLSMRNIFHTDSWMAAKFTSPGYVAEMRRLELYLYSLGYVPSHASRDIGIHRRTVHGWLSFREAITPEDAVKLRQIGFEFDPWFLDALSNKHEYQRGIRERGREAFLEHYVLPRIMEKQIHDTATYLARQTANIWREARLLEVFSGIVAACHDAAGKGHWGIEVDLLELKPDQVMALAYWLSAEQGFGTAMPERNTLRVYWSGEPPKSWHRIEVDHGDVE